MSKADITRHYILEKAFQLIYEHGYQATSVDKILETTDVTKGAFYYHFKNKEDMGLAMIKEIIWPRFKASLIDPHTNFSDPVEGIYETIKSFMMGISEDQLRNGCPTNNMIQEMAPLNDRFKQALADILNSWKEEIQNILTKAMESGRLGKHDYESVASFIVAGYEGTRGIGKLYHSYAYYDSYLKQLKRYLGTL